LDDIIAKHQQTANLQVVFLDIAKYSKRRTACQIDVIQLFTKILERSILETGEKYADYIQKNGISWKNDLVVVPTGDGAAVIFSFDGLHDAHLTFALTILANVANHAQDNPCEKFSEQMWCNCHDNFQLRVGISEGKGVIYRDVNANYNVAGDVVNVAARVMGLVDAGQICFTQSAYRQIVDLVDDADLVDKFVEFKNVRIKHGLSIDVYQFIGESENGLSVTVPTDLKLMREMQAATELMKSAGMPMPMFDQEFDPEKIGKLKNTLATAMGSMSAIIAAKPVLPHVPIETAANAELGGKGNK